MELHKECSLEVVHAGLAILEGRGTPVVLQAGIPGPLLVILLGSALLVIFLGSALLVIFPLFMRTVNVPSIRIFIVATVKAPPLSVQTFYGCQCLCTRIFTVVEVHSPGSLYVQEDQVANDCPVLRRSTDPLCLRFGIPSFGRHTHTYMHTRARTHAERQT